MPGAGVRSGFGGLLRGRGSEIGLVRSSLEGARAGAGSVILVSGEAGIGKSSLLTEALALAREGGARVLVGVCEELERARPFGAMAKAFAIDGPAGDTLSGLLEASSARASPVSIASAPDVQFRVLDAFVELAQSICARDWLVLAIEDLHWADPSTLLAFRALGRHAPQLRLCMLGSLRPLPRSPELGKTQDELLNAGALHVQLGPLDASAVAELVEQTVSATPGPKLLRQVSGAGGNPLFVLELVRAFTDEGSIVIEGGSAELREHSLPPTLRQTIVRRLGFLSADELQTLRVASTLGTQFSVGDLSVVARKPVVELLPLLQQPLGAGLICEAGIRLAFRHELVREAIYEDVPLAVRRGLHSEAGRALAEAGAPAAQVAIHLALGASRGDSEAVVWLRRAAHESTSRAPGVGVELLERALQLTSEETVRDEIKAELAPALVWSSRLEEGELLAREVLASSPGAAGEGPLRLALAQSIFLQGRMRDSLAEIESAAAVAPPSERAPLLAQTALGRMTSGNLDGAVAAAEEAIAAGELARDTWARCIGEYAISYVAFMRGHIAEAVAGAERAAATAAGDDDVRWREPRFYLGVVLMGADRFEEAERALQEGRRVAEDLGSVWDIPLYHLALSLRRFWTGEWDDAIAEAEAGLLLAEDVGTRVGTLYPYSLIALIAIHRDELPRARTALAEAQRVFDAAGPQQGVELMRWAQALLHRIEGDSDRALSVLAAQWDVMAALGLTGQLYRPAPDLVRLALAAGDTERARAVTETVERAAERVRMPYAEGAAVRCRGLLEGDANVLARAAEIYRATPRPVERAFACEDAGLFLAQAGRTAEAAPLLKEALETYERVGALRDTARLEAAQRKLGVGRVRRGRGRPTSGWESLTATELEVARLVAEGLTNSEIGRRMYISPRTVQTHMSHVFAKLGMSSRAQVGAEAARRARG